MCKILLLSLKKHLLSRRISRLLVTSLVSLYYENETFYYVVSHSVNGQNERKVKDGAKEREADKTGRNEIVTKS